MSNLSRWKYDIPSLTYRLNTLTLPFLYWYVILLLNDLTGRSNPEDFDYEGRLLLGLVHRSRSVALLKSLQALSLRGDLFDPLRKKLKASKVRIGRGKKDGRLERNDGSVSPTTITNNPYRARFARAPHPNPFLDSLRSSQPRVNAWTKCIQSVTDDVPLTFGFDVMKDIVAEDLRISKTQVDEVLEFTGLVRGASIGQVYKARLLPSPILECLLAPSEYSYWAGKTIALKVQRPNVSRAISLDVFLITEAAYWMSSTRAGDVRGVAEGFGEGLFGELDYGMEARNANEFRDIYGDVNNVFVPRACEVLTRGR